MPSYSRRSCQQCRKRFAPRVDHQTYCSAICQRRAAMTRYDQRQRERIIREYLATKDSP